MAESSETFMNQELIASQEQARLFVETNKIEADSSKAVCGDGRFTPEQSRGYIRMFGGDEGLLMAIYGAMLESQIHHKISYTELVARFGASLREERGDGVAIGVHTDTHNLGDAEIGCGHVAKAVKGQAKHKHVKPEHVMDLHSEIISGEHEKVILDGHHQEQAVLLVYGRDWSVNSFDGENMYFVVDIDRSIDLINRVVPALGIEGLSAEMVKDHFECQMNETASHLAAGKDIFAVRFADNDPKGHFEITHVGIVPQPEAV